MRLKRSIIVVAFLLAVLLDVGGLAAAGEADYAWRTWVSNTDTQWQNGSAWDNTVLAWVHDEWTDAPKVIEHLYPANAKWVWPTYEVSQPETGQVFEFRHTFNVPGNPVSGRLFITADNGFEARINGQMLCKSATVHGDWKSSDLTESYVNSNGWQDVVIADFDASWFDNGINHLEITVANEQMDGGTPTSNPGGVIFRLCTQYDPTGDLTVQKVYQTYFPDAGGPLAGIEFELWDYELEGIVRRGVTDAAGQIVFSDLMPGIYNLVEAEAPEGYFPLQSPMEVRIDPGTDEMVGFANGPCGRVEISKVWVPYGQTSPETPHAGVRFKVFTASSDLLEPGEDDWQYDSEVATDSEGKIVLNLPPGWYKIAEQPEPGYTPYGGVWGWCQFPISGGELTQMGFTNIKDPAPTVEGKLNINVVKTDDGSVAGLPVTISGGLTATLSTNASGTVALAGLDAGTYTVNSSDDGYASDGPKDVEMPTDSSEKSVTITLTPKELPPEPLEPGAIEGYVSEEDTGTPLPGATVELLGSEGGLESTTTAGALGYYRFDALAPGGYKVNGSLAGYESDHNSPVTVSEGETTRSDLVLAKEIVVPPTPPEVPPDLPKTGGAVTGLHAGIGAALILLGASNKRRGLR